MNKTILEKVLNKYELLQLERDILLNYIPQIKSCGIEYVLYILNSKGISDTIVRDILIDLRGKTIMGIILKTTINILFICLPILFTLIKKKVQLKQHKEQQL